MTRSQEVRAVNYLTDMEVFEWNPPKAERDENIFVLQNTCQIHKKIEVYECFPAEATNQETCNKLHTEMNSFFEDEIYETFVKERLSDSLLVTKQNPHGIIESNSEKKIDNPLNTIRNPKKNQEITPDLCGTRNILYRQNFIDIRKSEIRLMYLAPLGNDLDKIFLQESSSSSKQNVELESLSKSMNSSVKLKIQLFQSSCYSPQRSTCIVQNNILNTMSLQKAEVYEWFPEKMAFSPDVLNRTSYGTASTMSTDGLSQGAFEIYEWAPLKVYDQSLVRNLLTTIIKYVWPDVNLLRTKFGTTDYETQINQSSIYSECQWVDTFEWNPEENADDFFHKNFGLENSSVSEVFEWDPEKCESESVIFLSCEATCTSLNKHGFLLPEINAQSTCLGSVFHEVSSAASTEGINLASLNELSITDYLKLLEAKNEIKFNQTT